MISAPFPLRGGSVKRLVVLSAAVTVAATSGLGATALAAPSQSGLTHRNVHVCGTPAAGFAACSSIRHDTLRNGQPVSPAATPSGYGPADIQSAYNLTGASSGGKTVAIVDAYDLPTAEQDL